MAAKAEAEAAADVCVREEREVREGRGRTE
jgi:hypothetical protein